jgi:hypothetical protein
MMLDPDGEIVFTLGPVVGSGIVAEMINEQNSEL